MQTRKRNRSMQNEEAKKKRKLFRSSHRVAKWIGPIREKTEEKTHFSAFVLNRERYGIGDCVYVRFDEEFTTSDKCRVWIYLLLLLLLLLLFLLSFFLSLKFSNKKIS